jgi:5'-nucleotidase / UDP-sugar diphosphatase
MGRYGAILLATCLVIWGVGAFVGCGNDNGDQGNKQDASNQESDAATNADGSDSSNSSGRVRLRILHTNDIHSHLWGFGPESEYTPDTTGDDRTVGGFARLATLVKQARDEADDRPVLLLDSGDMTQGTLFTMISPTVSPELVLMQELGYDVVTLGNHEFDWTSDGAAHIVQAARNNGVSFPILSTNIVFSASDPADDALEALMASGKITRTTIKELSNGLKVGFIGLMGTNASSDAPAAKPVTFDPIADSAAAAVKSLKAQGADLIIALSHSGVDTNPDNSEDQKLAQAVPEINIIISGHTHTELDKPIVEGDTLIVQAGCYLSHLGVLDVEVKDGKASLVKYELKKIDDSIFGDPDIQKKVANYKQQVNTEILADQGVTYDKPVAETDFDLTFPYLEEGNLGNFVVDAILQAARDAEPDAPADFAIEAAGVIRDPINAGSSGIIGYDDAFRVLSMSTKPGIEGGMPLVSVYLTAAELRAGVEITPTYAFVYSADFFLAVSGLQYTYDPNAPAGERVKDIYLGNDVDGYSKKPLDVSEDNTKLYKVVMNYYIGSTLLSLGSVLGITPKDENGDVIHDINTRLIDAEPGGDLQELKEFSAFLSVLSSFPDKDGDGLPEIPDIYREPSGRIRAVTSAGSP